MADLPLAAVRERLARLPPPLRQHVGRVAEAAVSLARRHGVDAAAAEFVALAHDLARAEPPERLREQARAYALPLNSVVEQVPLLLHGPVAAERLRRELGVAEEAVLAAVRHHTTGRPGMCPLEMVLFLADKTEPGRRGEYPHWAQVRGLAQSNLKQAILCFVEGQRDWLRRRGLPLHPDTEATWHWLQSLPN